jgi:hypothetical protein
VDELELLIAIVVGLFKLVRFIFRLWFRLLFGGLRLLFPRARPPAATRAAPMRTAAPQSAKALPARMPTSAATAMDAPLRAVLNMAEAEARRCAAEEANRPFVVTLEQVIARARQTIGRPVTDAAALEARRRLVEQLAALVEMVEAMTQQRRDPALLDLLGDADALADACYRPIVEHCRRRGIRLSSDRARTILGGDKLFFFSVDDPTGLATIVLPTAWATQIGWWPALAHEIAHDFYRSVAGLDAELTRRLRLVPGRVADERAGTRAIEPAVAAWREELFADAFGTMMLGPAYVHTMSWVFGAPARPIEVCAALPDGEGGYEEHPPRHVRVVCAARLLGAMGYGAEGDALEAAWRRRHKEPRRVLLPTAGGRWLALDDEMVIERAGEVGTALYETGFDVLAGVPLRSLTGLDFGPREHQLAIAVRDALIARQRPKVRDARLVITGSVLAWIAAPGDAARIYAAARDLIEGVGAPRQFAAPAAGIADGGAAEIDAAAWRDAVVLDAILQSPRLRRRA